MQEKFDLFSVNDRILLIMKEKGFNKNSLSKLLDVSQPTLKNLEAKENLPSFKLIFGIIKLFDDISIEWLLTGRGEMLRLKDERMPPVVAIVSKEECSQCKTLLKVIENQNEMIDNLKQELIQQKK